MSSDVQGRGTGVERSSEFGVFVFLVSEGLLFAALVLGYLVARLAPGADFGGGSRELSLPLGTVNTAVLLTSSFAIALATIWGEEHPRWARIAALITAVLGIVFLGIKAIEYFEEVQKGLLPFRDMADRFPKGEPQHLRLFFDVYLALTGTHALHVISGIGLVGGIALFWRRLARPAHTLKMAALYWHFIDVIWVFLFPLLYLVR
ncbi:MAG TPA: cytochrome c oxidase subunit 3 [Hyphomicrobiaceae bacterium]|nr:cytochrome c oxidase subunit 3 [Hyphomicrobiaceae bacterium]